ncbi:ABC-F family ATP-binding cassette domain-containing protein [Bacillus sp. PS06]|uniref:ABC-F family ATP-binding cassette domain-containing protein n=1 Tax=Bacillus sp. PS06 TaxID=2764176 RepID=UPI001780C4AC|nr:ABC-F family ATP-binding cassette domain-containing protein [Bacillus sp. PS06]MBD8068091.1 ABC-F family ATP-binding cassette domain-containing protein [Bacillus sp. PS06]
MKLLNVENISKSYTDKKLFDQISFSITNNERIGIIGINGTGKSTLLKVIAGIEELDSGQITHSKGYTISYLPQQPEFIENNSVLEQVFHGDTPLIRILREYEEMMLCLEKNPMNEKIQHELYAVQQRMDIQNAWEANSNAKAVLTKLGIHDFTARVGDLSGGQKKRIALAQSLIQTPDLLILDEPTNHLDYETINWLEEYLSKYNGALLLVTHDRYFLDRVTNRILEIDNGKIYSYQGNYGAFLEAKALRMEQELASEQKLQNLYRKELAWIRRGAKARTTKQKARIQRFDELEGKTQSTQTEKLDLSLSGSRLGKKVFELRNISKSFEEKQLINDFTFIIKPHDRIGIVGKNGSGKSTLLNILYGSIKIDEGEIEVGQTVKIGYYTQENKDMDLNKRMIEYIKESAEAIHTSDGKLISAAQMLERFLFPMNSHGTPIHKLSGGERRRLYLLKILMTEPNVLLMDEPTNDLDTETLTVLEDYLDDFPGVVITVSHDRYFLDKVADQLLVFGDQGKISSYIGLYSDYLENSILKQNDREQKVVNQVQKTEEKPKKKKLSYNEQREWDEIEEKIALQEEKCSQLLEEIDQAGSDYQKAQQLTTEHEQENKVLEELIERWTELSDIVENS